MKNKYCKKDYTIICKCGHEITVSIGGYDEDYRMSVVESYENKVCQDCEFDSKMKSLGLDFITLEGSKKQIKWSKDIILNWLKELTEDEIKELIDLVFINNSAAIKTNPNLKNNVLQAKFFIENRDKKISKILYSYRNLEKINKIEKIEEEMFDQNVFKEIVIPDNIKEIGNYAFIDGELEKITLSNNLEKISKYAFSMNKIKELVIPNSVKRISREAFSNNNIEKLTLSKNLRYIPVSAFYFNKLKEVVIPEGIKKIHEGSFKSNYLEKVIFPKSLEIIGSNAFISNELVEVIVGENVDICNDAFDKNVKIIRE